MARITFAWELGGGLGHVVPGWDLGVALADRGHELAFALREPASFAKVPGAERFPVVRQAPYFHEEEGPGLGLPCTYAEILIGVGWRSPETLRPLLEGWLALYEALRPDAVIEDYGPTALVAAQLAGIRRMRCANGFSIPPLVTPIPPFRFDVHVPPERVAESEAHALRTLNEVVGQLGHRPFATLADAFRSDEEFLCTFPELDSYGSRPRSGYWGPRARFNIGEPVSWPKGPGPCVLVYLYKDSPHLDSVIDELASRPCRVVAYIGGLSPERRDRLAGPSRHVAERPVRLDYLFPGCDLVVSHAGGLSVGSVLQGLPQFAMPLQYEQYVTARRLEQIGAGGWVAAHADAGVVRRVLDTMLREPRFRLAAGRFADRYRGFSADEQRRRLVRRIEEHLAR